MTQSLLFADPAPAATPAPSLAPPLTSLWRLKSDHGRENVVYELDAIDLDQDPVYCFRLRLVEVTSTWNPKGRSLGDTMHVELAWFSLRGDVAAAGGGA